jgi:hypothetical protein
MENGREKTATDLTLNLRFVAVESRQFYFEPDELRLNPNSEMKYSSCP